ncbi:MAG: hypothetical protein NVS2B7_34640 [Herpetosiphon sp.]
MQREQQRVGDLLALAQVRAARGVTQSAELVDGWDVYQANVSRVEYVGDVYLSTLRIYISASVE